MTLVAIFQPRGFGSVQMPDILRKVSLKHVLNSLNNIILVGHSFSGLYPLLFPEIEKDLLDLVIISSASRPWIDQALKKAKVKNLPSFEKEMAEFLANKTPETFNRARKIFVHYYLTLRIGRNFYH